LKLLILTPNDNTGGTERVSAIYAHSLCSLGVHVRVCAIFKPLKAYEAQRYPSLHFSLYLSRFIRPLRPVCLYICLYYFAVRGYRLFIQGEYPAAVAYFLPFRVFIRVTNLPGLLKDNQPLLYLFFIKALKKNICIFPSKYFKNNFPVEIPHSIVLPNPFAQSDAPPPPPKELGSPLRFIAVGQLNHQKNHEFMISAFCSYVTQHERTSKLYIYGEGPLRDNLSSLIQSLGMNQNIFLMGWNSSPWSDQAFDFHLLTSRWEGYPNVIVEACYYNIPTLSLIIPPGIHTLIADNHIGMSCDNNSSDAYVSLLTQASYELKSQFTTSSHFDDFVSSHSPELLTSTIKQYV
jgi:glycosyltransferase involved in cell wall biosynthesis